MNIWDILILLALGALVAAGLIRRKHKKGCGCGCGCDGCTRCGRTENH